MNTASLAESYYFVTLRDDFTGYGVVNFMKRKSETFNHLKNYVAKLENEKGHSFALIRTLLRFDRTMVENISAMNLNHGYRSKASATKAVPQIPRNKME
jgi:hypothetical protein